MDLVYRLLGAVARLSERISHFRLNLIPGNWIAMIGLGALLAAGANETRDAVINGRQPQAVKVGDLLAHRNLERNYVSVRAPLIRGVIREREKGSGTVHRTWGLLLDPAAKRGMLAEFPGDAGSSSEEIEGASLTGMVARLDGDLRRKLDEGGGSIGGIPIERDYVLKTGRAPGSAAVWGVITGLSALLLALLGAVFLMKYTVFRPMGGYGMDLAAVSTAIPEKGIDLRATGRFVLDEKNAQRFLDVPVAMGTLETGELALVANVDASHRFMGVTTEERKGFWGLLMEHGSVCNVERGLLYIGRAVRPALRFRYRAAGTHATETAIVSVGNAAEREAIAAELSKVAGVGIVTS